jgi:hypothetical protein
MPKILADHNIAGHLQVLLRIWISDDWRGLWEELDGSVATFASEGLNVRMADDELWRYCQANHLLLLTGNRNEDSADSLQSTLRKENVAGCLPVFTIADPDRVMFERTYAELVAVRILDYLQELDDVRGTGRLFVP